MDEVSDKRRLVVLRGLYFLLGFFCGATAVLLALIALSWQAGWNF